MLTLSELVGDEGDGYEGTEHDVGLVVASEDSSEAFDASEEAFDLIAALVQLSVVLPGFQPAAERRYYRSEAKSFNESPGFIAFVSTISQERHLDGKVQAFQEFTSSWRVMRLSRGQGEAESRFDARGNQMNLCREPTPASANGLRPPFLRAPVPSG